jgi:hypothetical protein
MKRVFITLIFATLLAACAQAPTVAPTITASPFSAQTATATPAPTLAFVPTITYSSPDGSTLPVGWRLDEYPVGTLLENRIDDSPDFFQQLLKKIYWIGGLFIRKDIFMIYIPQ